MHVIERGKGWAVCDTCHNPDDSGYGRCDFHHMSEGVIDGWIAEHLIEATDLSDWDEVEALLSALEDAGIAAHADQDEHGVIYSIDIDGFDSLEIDPDVIEMWREQVSLYEETLAEIDRGRFR